ncbi:MAG: type II toxin-antitoxin system antitoxin SocA domain-containing protein [Pseudomonadota bacterium]
MIGQFIREQREKKQIKQEELADILGIKRQTLARMERGTSDISYTQLQLIAKCLDTHVADLVSETSAQAEKVELPKSNKTAGMKRQKASPTMRISVPQKKMDKFKEVFLYILEKVGGRPNVGETVLFKLLYFIDFDYYELYEEQLIGATYKKNHFGPTPIEFKAIVKAMEKAGSIEKIKSSHFQYPQTKYLPLVHAEPKHLTAIELQHIDRVLDRLAGKTAKELSDYSHKDVPWITADNIIDYEAVFYRTEETSVRRYG